MQTFLPYPDFAESARVLDNKRLGKQRVECLQIYRSLTIPSYGWKNHPVVKMWKNHRGALVGYLYAIVCEWRDRKYKNNIDVCHLVMGIPKEEFKNPNWLGDERLHSSHRSNLLRKDFKHYSQFGWKEPNNLPYYWPVR